jgi:hypothetical protein
MQGVVEKEREAKLKVPQPLQKKSGKRAAQSSREVGMRL